MFKRNLPFAKIFFPFLLALLCAQLSNIPYTFYTTAFCIGGFFALFIFAAKFLPDYILYKHSWLYGACSFVFIYFISIGLHCLQQGTQQSAHYSRYISDSCTYRAVVLQPIITKPKSYKTNICITHIIQGNKTIAVQGEALCYFTKMDSVPDLLPGDIILCNSNFLPIKNNGNMGEFDYKAYCRRKNILHSCFVSKYQFIKTNKQHLSLSILAAKWRILTINQLKKFIVTPAAIGIAEALLIGDRADIDQETWDTYSRTGIVHIIAISGMHMGIIYVGLLGLLTWLPFFKKRKYIAIIIAVMAMWLFAFITGLPASVMRAAVMFTILAGATLLKRPSANYNALMVSAFILLCYNTKWLQDVGFQLSYAAVLGIMLFAKPIQNSLWVENKFLKPIWQLISGTLAAQIFTFPLCLYYFHQFPLIFLLSNLIAIPLTTIILYAEILLMLISFISKSLGMVLGKIITWLILLLNKSIAWLSTFSYITIYNVHCNIWQTLLLFGVVCLAIIGLRQKKIAWGVLSISCITLFYILQIAHYTKAQSQEKFIVYHVPKKTIIGFLKGFHYQLVSNQKIIAPDIKNAVEPSLIEYGTSNSSSQLLQVIATDSNFLHIQRGAQSCMVFNKYADSINAIMPAKYVILTQNTHMPLATIATACRPQCIIADGSNSMWKIEQWQNEAKDLHLQFFSTTRQGAFIAKL